MVSKSAGIATALLNGHNHLDLWYRESIVLQRPLCKVQDVLVKQQMTPSNHNYHSIQPYIHGISRYPTDSPWCIRYQIPGTELTAVSHGVYGISPIPDGILRYPSTNCHGTARYPTDFPLHPNDFLKHPTDSSRYPTEYAVDSVLLPRLWLLLFFFLV